MKGFIGFIRNHGVAGLAIGFALGQAASNLVTSFVTSIVNPAASLLTAGSLTNLASSTVVVGKATIAYGQFLSVTINTAIVLIVIYTVTKLLRLEKTTAPNADEKNKDADTKRHSEQTKG